MIVPTNIGALVEKALWTVERKAPSRLLDAIPDSVTNPVGEVLYRRSIATPETNSCQIDGRSWTVRSPTPLLGDEQPCYEPIVTRTIAETLTEGSVFWDIGAGVGYFPTTALKLTEISPRNIHAFEPDPYSLVLLTQNVLDAGGPVHTLPTNVGACDEAPLCLDEYRQTAGTYPDLVKIDAGPASGDPECNADQILVGMTDTIEEYCPDLLVEIHLFHDDYEAYLGRIRDVLEGNGYTFEYCRNPDSADAEWTHAREFSELPRTARANNDRYTLYAHAE